MSTSRRLYVTVYAPALSSVLAMSALTTACKKHQVAAQPTTVTPRPAAPKAKQRQNAGNPPASPVAPTVTTTPPATTPAQVAPQPRLGQMLSPEEERRYNALIDQSLANARGSLSSIERRSLTREQKGTVQQIRDFVQQAEETRKVDLLAAKGLADKAEVLARDLVRSVR